MEEVRKVLEEEDIRSYTTEDLAREEFKVVFERERQLRP